MKKVLAVLLVTLVASGVVMAQFKVTSVGGGLNVSGLLGPTGATEDQSKGGYGMGFGPFLGVGAKVRATMGTMPVRWTANVTYDIFQGSGGSPTQKVTQGALGIALGAEYALKEMKMGSMNLWPYVGGELQFNIYPEPTFDPALSGTQKLPSGSRIGLGLGGGVEYQLKEGLNLDLGLKLNFANLILTPSSQTLTEYGSDPKVVWRSAAVTNSTTSVDEGTMMDLQLRIGINYALK